MKAKSNLSAYLTYCTLYTLAILCNKYVLSSLGFRYPTIFQGWQTFVVVVLVHLFTGNVVKQVTLSDIVPWIPSMILYVGSIYSGSKALASVSIPTFLLSHGGSDVILILCDSHLPSNAVHLSMPLKMAGMLLALWSAQYDATTIQLTWLVLHVMFVGAFKTVSFWCSAVNWNYSNLNHVQRLYLNNLLGCVTLFPLALLLGHHNQVKNHFQYIGEIKFYIGCLVSGILGWAVNFMWSKISVKTNANSQIVQLASKVLAMILSMSLFPITHTMLLWTAILFGLSGDILHILGNMYIETNDLAHEMNDILVDS